ncbi:hypothetical protein [Acidovorax sp.]|uniref:hypothetical protein n=1 Tax=Acidovorax sp. TaxID=1872122 RepID=UPI00261FFA6C|nr:hypothetical protein [Acidovorax sp.]
MTTLLDSASRNPQHNLELELWDLQALEEFEARASRAQPKLLRVGAHLYSAMALDQLLARLAQFEKLSRVVVADDRVYDRDMPSVEMSFKSAFPRAQLQWNSDGVIAGKHGR